MGYDYDAIVIGSGFGGSVAALRLAQKGYRVAVLEQGRRVKPEDMLAADESPLRLFWAPNLGLKGFFSQDVFRHVGVVGGVGVGGGSIVYAAVLLEPGPTFYEAPSMRALGVPWEQELRPHLATAAEMLGRHLNPYYATMDAQLEAAATTLGARDSFDTIPLGIFAGEVDVPIADPYFGGAGPERTGCRVCGGCLTGCPYGAKNSLDKNYLFLAEKE